MIDKNLNYSYGPKVINPSPGARGLSRRLAKATIIPSDPVKGEGTVRTQTAAPTAAPEGYKFVSTVETPDGGLAKAFQKIGDETGFTIYQREITSGPNSGKQGYYFDDIGEKVGSAGTGGYLKADVAFNRGRTRSSRYVRTANNLIERGVELSDSFLQKLNAALKHHDKYLGGDDNVPASRREDIVNAMKDVLGYEKYTGGQHRVGKWGLTPIEPGGDFGLPPPVQPVVSPPPVQPVVPPPPVQPVVPPPPVQPVVPPPPVQPVVPPPPVQPIVPPPPVQPVVPPPQLTPIEPGGDFGLPPGPVAPPAGDPVYSGIFSGLHQPVVSPPPVQPVVPPPPVQPVVPPPPIVQPVFDPQVRTYFDDRHGDADDDRPFDRPRTYGPGTPGVTYAPPTTYTPPPVQPVVPESIPGVGLSPVNYGSYQVYSPPALPEQSAADTRAAGYNATLQRFANSPFVRPEGISPFVRPEGIMGLQLGGLKMS
jgi:hypothetical protein